MVQNDLPSDLVSQLRSAELKRYALATGWERTESSVRGAALYQHPSSQFDQLIVPVEGSDRDAYILLAGEVVRKLAQLEKRSPSEVLNDLLVSPSDVIRFRTVGLDSHSGNLPLEQTVQLLTGVRKLFLAVAHSVISPQHYFTRLRRTEAEEFVRGCQIGQTERGSFTLTVACPLDLPPVGAMLFEPTTNKPFARRVTELFLQTLTDLVKAVDLNQTETLSDLERYPGLSTNFCEALLLLRPPEDRSFVGVSVSWAKVYPVSQSHLSKREIELNQEVFTFAESLSRALRPNPSPREDLYLGFVEELRGGSSIDEGGPSGEVWFTVYEGGDFVRARAFLDVEQYALANTAHMSGEPVRVTGVLRHFSRVREIEKISSLALVRPSHELETRS